MYCDLNLPYEQPFSVATAAPLVSTAQKRESSETQRLRRMRIRFSTRQSLLCAVGFAGLAFNFIVDAPLKPKHVGCWSKHSPLKMPPLTQFSQC